MMAVRRTGTYLNSGSEATVRPPHDTMPEVANRRMQLTPIWFSEPCWTSLRSVASPTTPLSEASVPAGAFQTPRFASIRAYRPAMYPTGGSKIGWLEAPVGSSVLTHGKYSAP